MQYIVIATMKYKCSSEEFERLCYEVADERANDGKYQWKIWVNNEEEKTGKTIYLFKDYNDISEILEYLHMMAALSSTMLKDFSTEVFKVITKPSLLNNAPIETLQEEIDTPISIND
jgi:hypothetical protein